MYVAPVDYAVRLGSVALYAAYGSNMDPAQMLLRCPHSPQRGTGWLEGWRLTFGGDELGWDGALTTVVEDTAQRTFVALYDVPEIDEKELDVWDGVNLGFYSKIKVRVQTLDGDTLAWLYVLDAYEGGLPSAERLSILVDAAVKAGAPTDYIDWLQARPSNPPSGSARLARPRWQATIASSSGQAGTTIAAIAGQHQLETGGCARTPTASDLTCSARSVRVATTMSTSSPSGAGGGASSTGGRAEAAEADRSGAARRGPAAAPASPRRPSGGARSAPPRRRTPACRSRVPSPAVHRQRTRSSSVESNPTTAGQPTWCTRRGLTIVSPSSSAMILGRCAVAYTIPVMTQQGAGGDHRQMIAALHRQVDQVADREQHPDPPDQGRDRRSEHLPAVRVGLPTQDPCPGHPP